MRRILISIKSNFSMIFSYCTLILVWGSWRSLGWTIFVLVIILMKMNMGVLIFRIRPKGVQHLLRSNWKWRHMDKINWGSLPCFLLKLRFLLHAGVIVIRLICLGLALCWFRIIRNLFHWRTLNISFFYYIL